MAPDTFTLDLKLTDGNNFPADVEEVYDPPKSGKAYSQPQNTNTKYVTGIPGIRMVLPRTRTHSKSLESPVLIRATALTPPKKLPTMEHLIPVPKADSVIMIEITLNKTSHDLNLFLSFEKIPTYRSFIFATKVSALPKNATLGRSKSSVGIVDCIYLITF